MLTQPTSRSVFSTLPPPGLQARRNRGMILIVVVVILMLLALIGTAYIASTRSDRYAARQNSLTAQEDLLIEGVKNMAAGYIVGGLFDTTSNAFRPAGPPTATYHDYTSPTGNTNASATPPLPLPEDTWLAERVPTLVQDVASPYDATHTYAAGDIVASGGTYYASTVDGNTSAPPTNWAAVMGTTVIWPKMSAPLGPTGGLYDIPTGGTWDGFHNSFITSKSITYADGTTSLYPAVWDKTGTAAIAADADGDGIADAGLVKIPMKDLDGLTWYYGVRIIDNNSAVNTSVAWKSNTDYRDTASKQIPANLFPSNIDLGALLNTGDAGTEMGRLNTWRFNSAAAAPVDDTGANRSGDFAFISPYDQLWMQLGRRLSNPILPFQKTSLSDQINLAQRFGIIGSAQSNLEQMLAESIYTWPGSTAAPYPASPYAPDNFSGWFNELFDYGKVLSTYTYRTPRPLLVSRNPVSNQASRFTGTLPAGMASYPANADLGGIAKTSVNTATFPELWRAYWSVMVDTTGQSLLMSDTDYAAAGYYSTAYYGTKFAAASPYTPVATEQHQARMFRTPVRVPVATLSADDNFPPSQVALLRSAMAAVNTQNLLNNGINTQTIALAAGSQTYSVTVYGTHPQPYITEIFAQTDTQTDAGASPNPTGYVAVELYNPYATPIDMTGWHLATIARANGTPPPYTLTDLHTFAAADGAIVIPPNSYVVIENFKAGNTDADAAKYRPASAGTAPVAGTEIYVPTLGHALNNELVLLQPPAPTVTNLVDFVPIDSFDFTGLLPSVAGTTLAEDWHYQRDTTNWRFVYPGRYDGSLAARRQQGTDTTGPWDPTSATPADPWEATAPALPPTLAAANTGATYPMTFTIQLNNLGMPGPNPIAGSGNAYPFGGFARNGDILQVPFIGAYRITDSSGNLIELNAVTMDSVFAEDTDTADDLGTATNYGEQVGRFCPLYVKDAHGAGVDIDDFSYAGSATNPASYAVADGKWHYRWASKLFDYLTVLNPNDDYTPNASPARYTAVAPQPVANVTPGVANGTTENNTSIDGLININTASWKVLSTLPMITDGNGNIDAARNTALAQAIFKDRIKNGPFQSIFDLNRVPGFADFEGLITDLSTADPGPADGDITPLTGTDGVTGDFEARYLALNRISNLITTRSDSFTVYIVVEGWQNAGTAAAQRVTQRRAAYIVDRSGVTATQTDPQITYVPNQ